MSFSFQANEDHKLPGIDTALTGLHSLIQEYLSELNTAKPTGIEKDSMIEILKPDPTVRESHNVEVSFLNLLFLLHVMLFENHQSS